MWYILFSFMTILYMFNDMNQVLDIYTITCLVVNNLVEDYFYTFRYCWTIILLVFENMILSYFIFLGYMISKMLVFPTCLILGITSCLLLYLVRLIIKDIIYSN